MNSPKQILLLCWDQSQQKRNSTKREPREWMHLRPEVTALRLNNCWSMQRRKDSFCERRMTLESINSIIELPLIYWLNWNETWTFIENEFGSWSAPAAFGPVPFTMSTVDWWLAVYSCRNLKARAFLYLAEVSGCTVLLRQQQRISTFLSPLGLSGQIWGW